VTDTRREFDQVAGLYLPIGVAVVVVIVALVVVIALRYRVRDGEQEPGDDGPGGRRRPSRIADAPRAEALYAAVLVCIAALLVWRTFSTEAREDHPRAAATATIDVTAARWHWRFDYRGTGVTQLGGDRTPPTLVVPAAQPVRFTLVSIDVIHAFWIPARRFKRDANPGASSSFELIFPTTGFWRDGGECSEFCGLRHAQMRFDVDVRTPAAYAAWLRQRRAAAGAVGAAGAAG
jgi:cytochrome c oxidase subunit 2